MALLERYFEKEGKSWEKYLRAQQILLRCMKDKEYICSICHEPWQGESLAVSPCKHIFHEHCLMTWHRKSRECPLCRDVQSRAYYAENNFEFDVYGDLSYDLLNSVGFEQIYRYGSCKCRVRDLYTMTRGLWRYIDCDELYNLDSILALSPVSWSKIENGKCHRTVWDLVPNRNLSRVI